MKIAFLLGIKCKLVQYLYCGGPTDSSSAPAAAHSFPKPQQSEISKTEQLSPCPLNSVGSGETVKNHVNSMLLPPGKSSDIGFVHRQDKEPERESRRARIAETLSPSLPSLWGRLERGRLKYPDSLSTPRRLG